MLERKVLSVSDGVGLTYAIGKTPRYDKSIVTNIKYHRPMKQNEVHHCDIDCEDGTTYRLFQISRITFKAEE